MTGAIGFAAGLCLALASVAYAQDAAPQAMPTQHGFVSPTMAAERSRRAAPSELTESDAQRLEMLLRGMNRPGPALPEGRSVLPPPSVPPTVVPSSPIEGEPRSSTAEALVVHRNASLKAVVPSRLKSVINEPTVDGYDDTIVVSGNWYLRVSTDGGVSFSGVDPFELMADADAGFCCDQVVTYEPSRDLLFVLLVSIPSPATQRNTIRLFVVRGLRSGSPVVYSYDFTPDATLGLPAGEWFDFPKLTTGRNHVYLTANIFSPAECLLAGTSCNFVSSVMMRLPLDSIKDGVGFPVAFFTTAQFNLTVAEGIREVAYSATHLTTSRMRIFRWPDTSDTVLAFDRRIPAWSDAPRSCPGPDGRDWCGRVDGRITGAYYRDRSDGIDGKELGFMWSSAPQSVPPLLGRSMPYVRVVRFAVAGLRLLDVPDIWNPISAVVYPYAAPNVSGGLGVSIFFGGGPAFPTHMVCIDDDLNGLPPPWECAITAASTQGPNSNGWGDYVWVRPHWPRANTWRATGFRLNLGGSNDAVDPRYIEFGRARDFP
jgi:hypothetical protein